MLWRRRTPVADADSLDELRSAVSGVRVVREDEPSSRARLLRVVSEAVILQDQATELLHEIRDRRPLAEVARRGGPLATRFFALRHELPPATGAEMERQCDTASKVLDHHGRLIVTALDMLAVDWRSELIVEQLERLDGLGTPADRLDALYAELAQ
jgi:hypothetical protein